MAFAEKNVDEHHVGRLIYFCLVLSMGIRYPVIRVFTSLSIHTTLQKLNEEFRDASIQYSSGDRRQIPRVVHRL